MTVDDIIRHCETLPVAERISLVQALWDAIPGDDRPAPLTEDQRRVFARRLADLDANPDAVLTWEQIKARVKRTP
jgi:putative addiction module component (TIGR02574 family)